MGQPSKHMKNWNVISRTRIEDYSSYEEGLSSNGGSYAFFDDIYILRSGDGEYRKLVLHSTSAQFEYCAITENFTSCQQCEVINCPEIGWFYASDSYLGYDEDGYLNSTDIYLEEISVPISEQEAEAIIRG